MGRTGIYLHCHHQNAYSALIWPYVGVFAFLLERRGWAGDANCREYSRQSVSIKQTVIPVRTSVCH